MSKYCAVENQSSAMLRPGDRCQRMTRRSAFLYGSGRSSSALVTLNSAALAPIPMASDSTAASVKPGCATNPRIAYLTSCSTCYIIHQLPNYPITPINQFANSTTHCEDHRMDTHVKVLGALQIALGVIGLFSALVLVVVFGVASSAVGLSGEPDAAIALPIIGVTGAALVAFLVALSLPGIVIGIGLIQHRPWARIAGIVLSILGLMMIPFGTIVGVYGVWVLFSKEAERLFSPVAAQ